MSSNDPSAQTNISTDRDDEPGSTRAHEGAPAPEDVDAPRSHSRRARMPSRAPTANIGVVGLAVMGSNLARNLASREGNTVAIYNRSHSKTETLSTEHPEAEFVPAATYEEFAASLQKPRTAIIMVKAGAGTDAVIDALVNVFEPGDIIVDGGNALFTDTIRREKAVRETGINFVGAGISGGEEGALLGPVDHARRLGRVLGDARTDPEVDRGDRRGRAVRHPHRPRRRRPLREDGAQRHRVRRHAAHRRGVRPHPPRHRQDPRRDRRRVRRVEPRRARVVPHRDHRRGAAPGRCRDRQAARRRHPRPGRRQGHRRVDGADRAQPRRPGLGHRRGDLRPLALVAPRAARRLARPARPAPRACSVDDADAFIEDVRLALYASKIVAYSQGFDEIRAGAAEYDWSIDLGAVSKIWRGGCIIRAQFLNRIADAYAETPELPVLLTAPYFVEALGRAQDAWRRIVVDGGDRRHPRPGVLVVAVVLRRPARRPPARPRSCRDSATSSAPTPTSASTSPAPSTRCGRATAPRSRPKTRTDAVARSGHRVRRAARCGCGRRGSADPTRASPRRGAPSSRAGTSATTSAGSVDGVKLP